MRIIGNNPAADNAEITAVASGALANGDTVIVNADGTVSVVAGSGSNPSVGAETTFSAYNVSYVQACYDPVNAKVVVLCGGGQFTGPTAVVGTVSGTSISFGTAVEVVNVSSYTDGIAYDAASGKVVVIYHPAASEHGIAIVGTVSGTTISFGSPTTYYSAQIYGANITATPTKVVVSSWTGGGGRVKVGTVSGTSISFGAENNIGAMYYLSGAYDSLNGKVVIAFWNTTTDVCAAMVGTISGTSISFGTAVNFNTGSGDHPRLAFDTNSNKIVIAYQDNGNSYFGTSVVGTVSGTSISFGTKTVFLSATLNLSACIYDSTDQKIVIAWGAGTGYDGRYIIGTVSGTSISFGNSFIYNTGKTGITGVGLAYVSGTSKVAIAYRDEADSNYGKSVVLSVSELITNLTSENFIGFANGAAADTGTARVQIGSGINGAQSSLTAGQQYFVQTDGTLGLTAADPSVIAGTAISATEIIVKG